MVVSLACTAIFLTCRLAMGDIENTCDAQTGVGCRSSSQSLLQINTVRQKIQSTGAPFTIKSGACQVSGDCVQSPNYPKVYSNLQGCEIDVDPSAWQGKALGVSDFNVELNYDTLKVNNNQYSGNDIVAGGLNGVTPSQAITWSSDRSETEKGWKICAVTVTTTTTTTTTTPSPTTPLPRGPCGGKGYDASPWPESGSQGDFQVKIVNGQIATACEWKWQASLRRNGNSFCGGSLIHPKWVMSAAHCLQPPNIHSLQIVLGDHDKDQVGSNESAHTARRVINHPQYQVPSGMNNDFSLIELNTRAPENDCIGTVCVPEASDGDIGGGVDCWITGWGTLETNGNQPRYLQEAKVTTLTNAACIKQYGSSIHSSMICAQGRDSLGQVTDACQGDSGGPMVCRRQDGKYYLEGATSWGAGCADAKKAGIWARLSQVTAWTDSYVQLSVPVPAPTTTQAPTPAPTTTLDGPGGKCEAWCAGLDGECEAWCSP